MPDRFYIWEDDERSGPYTEVQVERMLEDELITFEHECENATTGECLLLSELFEPFEEDEEELEEDDSEEQEPEDEDEGEDEWEEEEAADDGSEEEWEYEDEEEAVAEESEEEEWEYEEEAEDEPEEEEWEEEWEEDAEEEDAEEEEWEYEEEEDDASPPPNTVLYHGHPTFLRYVGGFALAAMGVAFGLWLGPESIWYFIGGFGAAIATIIFVLVDRSTRDYVVTPKRIEMTWGLFARSSHEVRIEDIRTINVKKSGFSGMLGVGTVEFSSTGDGVDVTFTDIWAAQKVKLLVRELQDEWD